MIWRQKCIQYGSRKKAAETIVERYDRKDVVLSVPKVDEEHQDAFVLTKQSVWKRCVVLPPARSNCPDPEDNCSENISPSHQKRFNPHQQNPDCCTTRDGRYSPPSIPNKHATGPRSSGGDSSFLALAIPWYNIGSVVQQIGRRPGATGVKRGRSRKRETLNPQYSRWFWRILLDFKGWWWAVRDSNRSCKYLILSR